MAIKFSAIDLLNAVASRGAFDIERGFAYAAGGRHHLDIYRPRALHGLAPLVIFYYGGGWEEGDRANYGFVGAALAARGFVTIIPDYRVYPEVRFPAFVEDGALALRWARDHAATIGGDAGRLFVMGHSAGAHIAAMLNFDRRWLADVGLVASRHLRGFIGLAGPYDFLPLHSDILKTIFGPPEQLDRTQPINFVDADAPPAFLATGRLDRTVDPGNSTRLAARIRQSGGEATVKIYPHANHATILGAFSLLLRPVAPVLKDVCAFIAATSGGAHADAGRVLADEKI